MKPEDKAIWKVLALSRYRIVGRPSDFLVLIDVTRFNGVSIGQQLWSDGKIVKPRRCCICAEDLPKKTKAFRPLTNQSNRMERMCENCLELLSAGGKHER